MDTPDSSGSFSSFQKLVKKISETTKHTEKTIVIKEFLSTFKGDVYTLFRLLLCKEDKRVYNVREKMLLKTLSILLGCSLQDMLTHLEQGDIGETAKKFFVESGQAQTKCSLTLKQVDDWLDRLTEATKEEQQQEAFRELLALATGDDLKIISKIIDHDLKVSIGARYALVALHPDAFNAYKNSNNLKSIIQKALIYTEKEQNEHQPQKGVKKPKLIRKMSLSIDLMTPIKSMLARPSISLEDTFKRCPNGMFAEIKYDGERIQIHKNGEEYKTFSRNLKPVAEHKVEEVKKYIPQAFSKADTIILDGEILLMHSETHLPLPFGSLGIHKKKAFSDATVCLIIFDILYLNGEVLLNTPLIDRRKILEDNVKLIPGRIALSELHQPTNTKELTDLFHKVAAENIEGLVVKDCQGLYEANMRHWIKIKKEHFDGMGDSADLIVLGAYFGTGSKGGLMSIFLMGVYDEDEDKFKTVCKVGNGFSDKTIAELQNAFPVKKIEKDPTRCPSWLLCSKILMPDFVVQNPKESPVWEIIGAEFSVSTFHTADNISIRFPRVTRIREDKDWSMATTLKQLQNMYDQGGINRTGCKKMPLEDPSEEDNNVLKKMKILSSTGHVVASPIPTLNTKIKTLGIEYVSGNITEPLSKDEKKMLFLPVNHSGKWPNAGVFKQISSKWSTPQETYKGTYEHTNMGKVVVVPVGDGIFVTFLFTLKTPLSGLPPIKMDVLEDCFGEALKEAKKHQITSVHLSRLPPETPKLDWNIVEQLLVNIFAKNGIKPYVYEKSIFTTTTTTTTTTTIKTSKKAAPIVPDPTLEIDMDIVEENTPKPPKAKSTPLFKGLNILSYGEIEQTITSIVTLGGGTLISEDDENMALASLTHIVTNNPWEELFSAVLEENPNCKIVTPQWLATCSQQNKIVEVGPFLVKKSM